MKQYRSGYSTARVTVVLQDISDGHSYIYTQVTFANYRIAEKHRTWYTRNTVEDKGACVTHGTRSHEPSSKTEFPHG